MGREEYGESLICGGNFPKHKNQAQSLCQILRMVIGVHTAIPTPVIPTPAIPTPTIPTRMLAVYFSQVHALKHFI